MWKPHLWHRERLVSRHHDLGYGEAVPFSTLTWVHLYVAANNVLCSHTFPRRTAELGVH